MHEERSLIAFVLFYCQFNSTKTNCIMVIAADEPTEVHSFFVCARNFILMAL